MSRSRTLARIAVPFGMAAAAVTIAAAPALADSTVTVSGASGGVVDHTTTLSVVGHYDNSQGTSSKSVALTVTDPNGVDHTLWSGNVGPLSSGTTPSQQLDTSCPSWTSPCQDAINGTYSFVVHVGSTASRAVTVAFKVPPAQVSGFGGSASGTIATFGWHANSEPDLDSYDVRDASGNDVTPGGLDPGSVCDSSGCSVSIQFGSAASGTTEQFSIIALRRSGGGGTIAGAPASTSVSFPKPPSSPSGGSGGTGGTAGGGSHQGGTGGGTATGGSGGGSTSTAHPLSGKHPAADLRSYLPTITAGAAPNLPSVITEVKPLPMGTYRPLVYPNKVKREALHAQSGGVGATMARDIANVVDSGALWRSLAGAAVLMLIAAHLRAWVERTALEDE